MADRFYDRRTVQCPYPYYDELRARPGVHRLEGEDVFLVTRHRDCEAVLARVDDFSNKAGPGLRQQALMGSSAGIPDAKYRVVRTLLTNDPPSHTHFRRIVARAFTARRIAALEPRIHAVANELIDAFPRRGDVDFVRQFAKPLPLLVIADFLGVPRHDLDVFEKWSDDAAEVLGGTLTPGRSRECQQSLQELLGYFADRVADRRRHPADDFLGVLVDATEAATDAAGERPLTEDEILAISYVTLVAGNETTVNLLSGLMLLLQQHPDQLARIRADRTYVANAVEEALRLEAPVQGSVRRVRTDTAIAGTAVPEGSRVLIVAGAANRDADVFDDPDAFDVGRTNSRGHLSFGKGIHFCLGAALSRLEAVVALDQLLERLSDFEMPDEWEPQYKDNAVLRSLLNLPLRVAKADA